MSTGVLTNCLNLIKISKHRDGPVWITYLLLQMDVALAKVLPSDLSTDQ